ncbi:MAG: hypothetical protein PHH43_00040 [Candidatus Cloacimonetes bacterium]|nr:hypothetical protein [Candidatus Cloacimonadota bacterium]MDD3234699.1 hypothetical protein [Candidatus Cloacimonadota bacterium]
MTEKKKKQTTWKDVKSILSKMRSEELISTIEDLYKLRKENKQFLHTRYKLVECSLDEFKLQISKGVNPALNGKISFKNARQALSDYKQATGDMEGLAELMVFYCEECAKSIQSYGVWEQYANATINIWIDTLKHIEKLPQAKFILLWKKLESAFLLMGSVGWGIDCISDFMYEYTPNDDVAKEIAIKTKLPEDMW